MLSNPTLNLLRTKKRLKLCVMMSFHTWIWHVVVFLKNGSPEMLPGKLVSAIRRINNRDQLAICALINGVPQEGCVPLVLNTAGSSLPLPLTLWLSACCRTRRWDQDVERLKAFFPPLHYKQTRQLNLKLYIIQSDARSLFLQFHRRQRTVITMGRI